MVRKDFPIEKVTSKDYVMKHVRLAVCTKLKDADVVHRAKFGFQFYLKVIIDDISKEFDGAYNIPYAMLSALKIDEEELWSIAEKNTRDRLTISPLSDFLGMGDDLPLLVVSTNDYFYGASALYFSDLFATLCFTADEEKLLIIPSSIHEILVAPYGAVNDTDGFNRMVAETNEMCVDPEDRLASTAYIYDRDSNKIKPYAGK